MSHLSSLHARRAARSIAAALLGILLFTCWYGTAYSAPPSCNASSTAVNFGNYLPSSTTPLSSTGTITLNCNRSGSYSIALSMGQGGSYNPRSMSGGSPVTQLNYNLFTNAQHTIIWGDGITSSTQVVTGSYSKNVAVSVTVYGLLSAQQNVPAGNYTDSITATITY